MTSTDLRGLAISGATAPALDVHERALAAFLGWRREAGALAAAARQAAPAFVMAHVLEAWRRLCSRDPASARSAGPVLARAAALPANLRERLHLAAIGAALADDYDGARSRLGELLRLYPRDVLALQGAHALDHLAGDVPALRQRVAAVLPAWSPQLPGYRAVLAMHAFGLAECGELRRAEQASMEVLAHDGLDPRAHHTMAHLFEMTERAEAGLRWMSQHAVAWSRGTVAAVHCWWHLALFQLARGRFDSVFHLYDRRIRQDGSTDIADLIDATALLWRSELAGADPGGRWAELAQAWAPHIDDGFCSFSDLHAMLAFAGARDWVRAHRLESALLAARAMPTRHGETTRRLGLAACQAVIAFARGNDSLAITLLSGLPAQVHRLGGSHAQRDVLHLTWRRAVERLRRASVPARRAAAG